MELKQVIETRRSARKFQDKPVPKEVLAEMLEAARLSPSGGNSQSYWFGVIQDPETKVKLAQAAGEQTWIGTAPLVFACCADLSWDLAEQPEDDFAWQVNQLRFNQDFLKYLCTYPDRKARTTLFQNATPLIPAEHIFLTAVANGLSACFIGYLDVEAANRILGLPDTISCLFLLPVGYADEPPKAKQTKALEEIVFYDCWRSAAKV